MRRDSCVDFGTIYSKLFVCLFVCLFTYFPSSLSFFFTFFFPYAFFFLLIYFLTCLLPNLSVYSFRHLWARGSHPSLFISSLPHLLLCLLVSFTFFFLALSVFLLFNPFPFYQNTPTPFPGQMLMLCYMYF